MPSESRSAATLRKTWRSSQPPLVKASAALRDAVEPSEWLGQLANVRNQILDQVVCPVVQRW
jgi:hypothetical protein